MLFANKLENIRRIHAFLKSVNAFGGQAARKALSTTTTSTTSCAIAPATGGRRPKEAEDHTRDAQRHTAHRDRKVNFCRHP
jgi:hypothetical protein